MARQTRTKTDNTTNKMSKPSVEEYQNSENDDLPYGLKSQQLLTLFPQLVWDHICSYLDSKDFLKLISSSLLFRELFYEKRVNLLYKPVLETLLPKLYTYETPRLNEENRNIVTRNVRSIILNCRKVCKSWKWTIDTTACTFEPHTRSSLIPELLSPTYTFQKTVELNALLQHFQTTHPSHANPFIGKYIHINVGLENPGLQFACKVSTLLEKYGKHIWSCQIIVFPRFMHSPQLYNYIMAWITCMPNLRKLTIYYCPSVYANFLPHNHPQSLPLQLKYLRCLDITSIERREIYNNIPDWSWLEVCNLRELIVQENLEVLCITIFNKKGADFFDKVTSPLKKLEVQYHCKENDVRLFQVFTILSGKLSNTLEDLILSFRVGSELSAHFQVMQDSFNGRLNLPKVRWFWINIQSMYCLDFLLGMQENLEVLKISCKSQELESNKYGEFSLDEKAKIELIKNNQVIKFLGYEDKMLESNIWSMFPKLKTVDLSVSDKRTKLDREDWLKIQKLN